MELRKKIWPEYFAQVASGKKTFEVRLANFSCAPGDTLLLEEWDPQTKQYTGRSLKKQVTTVFRTNDQPFYQPEDVARYGWQVIGLGE